MRQALEAIASMKVDENTNAAELLALCIATAKIELAKGASDTTPDTSRPKWMEVYSQTHADLIAQGALPSDAWKLSLYSVYLAGIEYGLSGWHPVRAE